ncbi:TonB-dependent receptor [Sphingomicrobium sediminis]|uniref:TonB-dependent receptor n=1 Tax=Sphingomicrobium sediminis TaxID=2950949 RepID=A0A9X2J100_9SPHN|nr:TonB-dependent receptor [Sphingomicrobium sediminis]MCM8556209.1 TonB-dependent receptor [Sphingomicrobium sediminis]
MKKLGTTTRLVATSSFIALGMATAAPAFAQDAGQDEDEQATANPNDPDDEGEGIIIRGFRAALESAVDTKRNEELIVESVTAEDIGKLPDASIGESIARLPGITSQRLNGRANVISIRGIGPDFSQTTLNGREQTTTGDTRAVEFDQYPSEIVSQVVVFKSPSANLVGQGLIGTIDIRTIRPLDYGEQVLAVGGRVSYADLGSLNAGSTDTGYRANATYVDQFADDLIGVALAASYVDEPYQNQEFNAWGYAGGGTADSPRVIGGSKSFVTSTQLKRFGVMGTVQARANNDVMLTLDGFYTKFDDDQSKRGIELPLGFGAFGTGTTIGNVSDGFADSGTFTNVRGVIRNDVFQREADLYSFGFNVDWDPGTGWKGFLDLSHSRTERNELSIESYAGTGFNGDDTGDGASVDIGFQSGETGTVFSPNFDYSDPNQIFLTDPLGWGGGTVPQAGYYNNRIVVDDLEQYRAELEREFDNSFIRSVQLGVNITDRVKTLTPDESLVRLPDGETAIPIPSSYIEGSTDLTYLGLGPILSYDPRGLIEDGVYVLEANNVQDVLQKAFKVNEAIYTGYLMANIDSTIGAGDLTGNIGIQVVNSDQSSSGQAFPNGVPTPVTAGDNYWHYLPSMNLSYRMPSDTIIRLAVRKEMQRPRLDDMRVAIGYGIDVSSGTPVISGGGGNPRLRPYEANSIDFNVEQYFGDGAGYVALQLYYKDIQEFIQGRRELFDYTGFPLPENAIQPPSLIGFLDAPTNVEGGELYGAEIAATIPFDIFTPVLSGFGVTGGVGYTKTEIVDGDNVGSIPGYSEWVANGTVFFEQGGFNARASARYRSSFLGDFVGFGGSPTRRLALGETIVDAQIGYDFPENSALGGLSLYLQGQNLTDERFASIAVSEDPRTVVDYQIYGRRFLAGFTYKFQ